MNIKKIVVGPLQTNCYVLEQNNQSLIIDPGDEVKKIEQNLKYPLIGIVITHYHNDHIGALEELVQKYKVTVYDVNNLVEGINNIENFMLTRNSSENLTDGFLVSGVFSALKDYHYFD